MSTVAISSSMNSLVTALKDISEASAVATSRLATGKRVNSAIDNPSSFFAAQAGNQRANQLMSLKDSVGQAIQTVNAASKGIDAISATIKSMQGVITQARTSLGDATAMGALSTQFNTLSDQLDEIVDDASYAGVNLLTSAASLKVIFNETATSSVTLAGFDASSTGLSIADQTWDGATATAALDTLQTALNAATTKLTAQATVQASNLSVLTTRSTFLSEMANVLQTGANALTLADQNEESANLLTLQTRQQLATSALSMANQSQSGILRLF